MVVVTAIPKNSYEGIFKFGELKNRTGKKIKDPFNLTIEDEYDFSKNDGFDAQPTWIGPRLTVLNSLREIVQESFDFNGKKGAEFGCGAFGWFYNFLHPTRSNWIQFDINPSFVKSNKEFSRKRLFRLPKVKEGSMYDMPLEDSSIDIILGYSSWDAIYFYDKSIKEIKRCLKPGGHFVHFQDLQPSDGPLILTEAKKRLERNLSSDLPVMFCNEKSPLYVNLGGKKREAGYSVRKQIMAIDSLDWGRVNLGKYLLNHLTDLLNKAGFKIKTSEERKKEILVDEAEFKKIMVKPFGIDTMDNNNFGNAYGRNDFKKDDSVPEGKVKQWASLDVLVVQKTD